MKKDVPIQVIYKRCKRRITSKLKKKAKRRKILINHIALKADIGSNTSLPQQVEKWLPETVKYFIEKTEGIHSDYEDLKVDYVKRELTIKIPKEFCLNTNIKGSILFISTLIRFILYDQFKKISIDYSKCKHIDLSAQICLDALLIDLFKFLKRRGKYLKTKPIIETFGGENINDIDIKKILFSIGSAAIINKKSYSFSDIVPYHLCVHSKEIESLKNSQRKEIDTTKLVEHVIESLNVINKELSQDTIEDLSTVFGEILINAEEHSTLNHRYSTGFFQKIDNPNIESAYGIYHLVILNFGESIYEKFKSPNCPNKKIVQKMEELSQQYTAKKLFTKSFHEASLWTLYSLQEGVTSVSTDQYKKRGNGSIRFIESFFNLRSTIDNDKISRLNIISGNTNILFDGSYKITNKIIENEKFKVVTFNESGKIEDKPDSRFVKKLNTFFPGTIISAKILITEDDFI